MVNMNVGKQLGPDKAWLKGLATSLPIENDYRPLVEGVLPADLRGTLFRNGPGRFDLGGIRKRHLLDGDGMIQAIDFDDGAVRYRNRFVRTEKYLAEEKAGRPLFPTWTTRAPGGFLHNLGFRIKSQAGVTVVLRNGLLYAFDEVGLPYGLDPRTLETLGEQQVGSSQAKTHYKAHTKTDGDSQTWVLIGVEHGPTMYVHVAEHSADGSLRSSQRVAAPRSAYFHDWFATENHVVVSLQPVQLSLARFLGGIDSYTDSMQWRADQGNLLMVIDRNASKPPLILQTSSCFMWHALNAYEQNGEIVADFVGYDRPDHFLGEHAAFREIMDGRLGLQECPGTVRRYVINLAAKRVIEEEISSVNHEFPMTSPRVGMHRHRYGYFTTAQHNTVFHNGLARVDMDTGSRDVYMMETDVHLGEPIFAPDRSQGDSEQGWLLTVGLDGKSACSFVAVFRSNRLADGPVAIVRLRHSTPLSFHGWWKGADHVS